MGNCRLRPRKQDIGSEIANKIARVLVMYHRRSGGQSQHSEMLKLAPGSDRIQLAVDYARSSAVRRAYGGKLG